MTEVYTYAYISNLQPFLFFTLVTQIDTMMLLIQQDQL